jgi:hypothetical protein
MCIPTLSYANESFFAALEAVANRRKLEDSISVPPFGQRMSVAEGLSLGSFLDEDFYADELERVRAALDTLGISTPDNNKSANAVRIFESLKNQI